VVTGVPAVPAPRAVPAVETPAAAVPSTWEMA